MYQSSKRQNFLDILIKPASLAMMGSIGLHTLIPPILPIFTQLEKPVNKPEPVSVKVLELSSSELQRIPQSPQASSQIIPPTATQTIPVSPVAPSTILAASNTPKTIPTATQQPRQATNNSRTTPSSPQQPQQVLSTTRLSSQPRPRQKTNLHLDQRSTLLTLPATPDFSNPNPLNPANTIAEVKGIDNTNQALANQKLQALIEKYPGISLQKMKKITISNLPDTECPATNQVFSVFIYIFNDKSTYTSKDSSLLEQANNAGFDDAMKVSRSMKNTKPMLFLYQVRFDQKICKQKSIFD